MTFYTAHNEPRPVRLSEKARRFAWESLHGAYGDMAMRNMDVAMDGVAGFMEMTEYQKYDRAIAKIAAEAPLRICEDELVSGAATLGRAIWHQVPASLNGEGIWSSVSHVTLGFDKAVKHGINATAEEIAGRLSRASSCANVSESTGASSCANVSESAGASSCASPVTESEREILESMQNTISSMRVWHERYMSALKDSKPGVRAALSNVPFEPPTSFHEAVQSLWFLFAFTRLCGNWPGIGRIDAILGGYLKKDLENGVLGIDEAREILASFFIKGCEWIQGNASGGSGDAQHYQNIVISGIGEDGLDITNEVTYLVLDIIEELGISDFPVSARINKDTPEKLLARIAEVMRHGGGVVAVYNEPLIIDALVDFGYPLDEARRFANDGCWEVQVPGKTLFSYYPFDSLQILLEGTLHLSSSQPAHFDNMDDLYSAFKSHLKDQIEQIYSETVKGYNSQAPGKGWGWREAVPCSVMSLFEDGCIENARSYLGGGSKYVVVSPHIGGAPDAGNSLYAIDKLVFKENKASFDELMTILQNNWEGYETLRQYALNKYDYYGNDNDEADAYTARVLNDFADTVMQLNGRQPCPVLFPPGVSTFGRQIDWAPYRAAVPFGRMKGEILSGNTSPTPGTDARGATAIIKSYCKAGLKKQANGAALDIKLFPSTIQGRNGLNALVALMRGFVELGGSFMQLDVMDAEVLRQAQERPGDFKTLSVRVSGWNARFVTLNSKWQDMVISRTAQGL